MFRDKLKELREDKKISQYELANIIHVSRGAISKWERGVGIPSVANLEAICEYFSVTEDYMFGFDDYKKVLNRKEEIINNSKYHLPVICISILCLILTAVELFVFVREGIQISNPRYYPNLSILTVLKGWSLIPISIYISFIIVDFILTFSSYKTSFNKRLVFSILSGLIVILLFITSFVIAYKIVETQNYGMFWKPH